jgi:methylated-DNA-[protein]-cysteine S-methyltransferase
MSNKRGARELERYSLFETPIGWCGIAWSEQGLTRLQLPEADREATERRLNSLALLTPAESLPPPIALAVAEIQQYLNGERADFATVPLDLTRTTPFHRAVYDATRAIGWGRTATYGDLARRTGSTGAARAVGQALARNPIAIIIPCHRILASGNRMGGFSAFGGTTSKERLLALEGVTLERGQKALAFGEAEG